MSGSDTRYLVIFDCGGVLVDSEILACDIQARAQYELSLSGGTAWKAAQTAGMLPLALLGGTHCPPDHGEDLALAGQIGSAATHPNSCNCYPRPQAPAPWAVELGLLAPLPIYDDAIPPLMIWRLTLSAISGRSEVSCPTGWRSQ